MDVSLIERLNALKLHASGAPAAAPTAQRHTTNQRDHSPENTLHEQFSRMSQQMQEHYERQLSEQQRVFAAQTLALERKADALAHENASLRRSAADAEARVADQHVQIELLQNEVKQLRLTNYRLQFMVQQNDRTSGLGGNLPPRPPDIF